MLRVLIILLLLLGLDVYAFQAFRLVFSQGGWELTALYGTASLFSLLMVTLMNLSVSDEWETKYRFYTHFRAFIIILYFAKIVVIMPLLLEDINRSIIWFWQYLSAEQAEWLSRNYWVSLSAIILGSIPVLILLYGMISNPYRFQLTELTIPIEGLPNELDGLHIVQISDLHSGTFNDASPFLKAVDMINAQNPDLVFFTGDLVNAKASEADIFVPVFKQIKSKYGVYSILGNHDYGDYVSWASEEHYYENLELLFTQHEKMDWTLLKNDSRQVKINGSRINIMGVENYSALPQFPQHGDLKKTWEESEPGDLNVLLSHDPTHWDDEVTDEFTDIQLTLSGHTHGFQFGIEIANTFRWSPSQWIYKQWAGLYREGNQYIYVNRGIGCLGYPGRVGILPEVTSIKLTKS